MRSKKDKIIRQISKQMYLREDVVADVINEYINTMIVETIANGTFNITNFFTIKEFEWKEYPQFDKKDTSIKPHWRLKVRLSKNMRLLYKYFGPNSENPNIITVENWKKLLEIAKIHEKERPKQKLKIKAENVVKIKPDKVETVLNNDNFNPFLDDEEEDY